MILLRPPGVPRLPMRVVRGRAESLVARGLLRPGQWHEDLVVVRADRVATGEDHERERRAA